MPLMVLPSSVMNRTLISTFSLPTGLRSTVDDSLSGFDNAKSSTAGSHYGQLHTHDMSHRYTA